jgi:DNA primase
LVYGLDLAVKEARKTGHLVLMEGYTDVIAAHQNGLPNTAAVLGTSTTDKHAKLLHRAGAQRISLVFDGDSAGREAAFRALSGLLPEDYALDVLQPPGGQDPCDLLMGAGLEPFKEALEGASGWFEFASEGLEDLHGNVLSQAVDRVLELILRVKAPVHQEDLIKRLAELLGMSIETLQGQLALTPEARKRARDAERERIEVSSERVPPAKQVGGKQADADAKQDPQERTAWGEIAGSLLLDSSLIPMAGDWMGRCPSKDIHRVLEAIAGLHADLDAEINVGTVMTALGEDPARALVGRIVHHAEEADSPRALFDGALLFLKRRELEAERDDIQERLAAADTPESERTDLLQRFKTLQEDLQNLNPNAGALAPSH